MFIVPETTLLDIQSTLVEATHSVINERGERMSVGTIDERRLAMAALVGLQIAMGEAVWPANRPIILPRRSRLPGPFQEET